MVNIQRVRIGWSGFPGAPGVSTFYALDGAALSGNIRTFFDNLKDNLPLDVTVKAETVGDIIDPLNGSLQGTWTTADAPAITGRSSGAYAAPSGLIVHWNTGDVLNGHRLRGKTFIVPLAGAGYQTDGSLDDAVRTLFIAGAAALVTAAAANFVVWHRPLTAAQGAKYKPPRPARSGGFSVVTGSDVPDKVMVLRSRRP